MSDEAHPALLPQNDAELDEAKLVGPLARAYREFCAAALGLEGKQREFTQAQERYRVALGRFSQLAAAASSPSADSGG